MKLVAFGVPAEVVVVLEDQDAGIRPEALPVVIRSRQPADATADDNEVVGLVKVGRRGEGLAVEHQCMCYLESSSMRSAHPGANRRVVCAG